MCLKMLPYARLVRKPQRALWEITGGGAESPSIPQRRLSGGRERGILFGVSIISPYRVRAGVVGVVTDCGGNTSRQSSGL